MKSITDMYFNLLKTQFRYTSKALLLFLLYPFLFLILPSPNGIIKPVNMNPFLAIQLIPVLLAGAFSRTNAYKLFCSLPVKKETVIKSRFISIWVFMIFFVLLYCVIIFAIQHILNIFGSWQILYLAFSSIVVDSIILAANAAFCMPLVIRFDKAGPALAVTGFIVGFWSFKNFNNAQSKIMDIYIFFSKTSLQRIFTTMLIILFIAALNYASYKVTVILMKNKQTEFE